MCAHFKKKTTLASSCYLYRNIKEGKVKEYVIYIFILIQHFLDKEKVLKFREAIWRLAQISAEVVGVLFISPKSAIW